jgi:hypothetical protein
MSDEAAEASPPETSEEAGVTLETKKGTRKQPSQEAKLEGKGSGTAKGRLSNREKHENTLTLIKVLTINACVLILSLGLMIAFAVAICKDAKEAFNPLTTLTAMVIGILSGKALAKFEND